MKRALRILTLLILAGGIVAAVVWAFLPEPVAVDLATVERGRLRVTVDEDGKTRIRERYTVSAPLGGQLLRIGLDPGDAVVAGKTLLARIIPPDPELLDARTVAQAEARVDVAAAALEKISPLLEQARAAQANAEEELQRARTLDRNSRQSGRLTITASELDRTELEAKLRAEDLRSAQIAQEIANFELQQARAALLRARPIAIDGSENGATSGGNPNSLQDAADGDVGNNLPVEDLPAELDQNFLIHSPINGRVLHVFQESSGVVTAGMPLIELGDPADLEVVVDVLSQDAVKIHSGDEVLLEHWGGSRPLEGRVRIVEPAAKTKISTLGVEEQRVDVIIDFLDPEAEQGSLGDGFRVEARVVIWQEDDVLKVPTSALFRQADDWAVFHMVEGRARATPVKIGQQNGLEAQVLEGLHAGDQVVIHPSDAVQDGVALRQR